MDPIFEIAVAGRTREVRVGSNVYPTFTPFKFLGRSCTPATLVEAPAAVGTVNGWTRRFDVERARKLRYEAFGAASAEMMREADAEGQWRLQAAADRAELEAERAAFEQDAADRQARERLAADEAERLRAEEAARVQAEADAAAAAAAAPAGKSKKK